METCAAQQNRSSSEDYLDGTPAKVQPSGPFTDSTKTPVVSASAVTTPVEASAIQLPLLSGILVAGGSLPAPAPSSGHPAA